MSPSIPCPETVFRAELPNGITVLARENPDSPSVVMGGYLWAGSMAEAPEQAGLAHFTAGILMRGTLTRTFDQINQALESIGAQLGMSAAVHTVSFGGKALADDLGLLLDILAGCLQQPTFPPGEVEKLQSQILTGLQRRAFDTRRMADLTFDTLLYPGHPYGRSVQGYEETIRALTRDDLVAYHQGRYSPQGMVVAIVGAVPPAQALEQAQAHLGGWEAPGAMPERGMPPVTRLAEPRRQEVVVQGKTQSDLVLGWLGVARDHPDYFKALLTNTVLGVFGMMGRLGDSIREEQGLAYYCYSSLEAGLGPGPWAAIAGVDPAHVEQTVESIRAEVRRLRDEPVPADELADSQSFLTGSMPLRLETNEGVANAMLDMERHGLGFDYLQRYPSLINAVTVDDVREMAAKYLDPDVYALAVAGPEAG